MVTRIALLDLNNIVLRRLVGACLGVVFPVEQEADRVEVRKPRDKPELLGSVGRQVPKELFESRVIGPRQEARGLLKRPVDGLAAYPYY